MMENYQQQFVGQEIFFYLLSHHLIKTRTIQPTNTPRTIDSAICCNIMLRAQDRKASPTGICTQYIAMNKNG